MIKSIKFTGKDKNIIKDLQKVWLSKYRLEVIEEVFNEKDIYNYSLYEEDKVVGLIRYKLENNSIRFLDTYFTEDKYILNAVDCMFKLISKNNCSKVELENGVDKRITDIIDKYGSQKGTDFEMKIVDFIDKLSEE